MKLSTSLITFGIFLLLPLVSFAQTPTDFAGVAVLVVDFVNLLIPALFAILFVYIMWKVIDAWILNAGDEKKRAEGRQFAVIAVLVFVLMFSVWGIIRMLRISFFG